MIACLITVPTFISLVVLLFWTALRVFGTNAAQNGQGGGEEGRGWWDGDMRPEELEALKVVLNLIVLTVACGTLAHPIRKAGSGYYERFNEGVLAAALFMFANMLFVSFWYFLNLGGREEEQNNNNNAGYYYGYNPYWAMDDRQRLVYHEKVVSYCSLALALAYYAVAGCVHSGAQAVAEDGRLSMRRPDVVSQSPVHANVVAQFKVLNNFWTFLSLCSVVIFSSLFIAACIASGGEEAERMREEGRIINMILVLLVMVLIAILMITWGSEVFTVKSTGSLGNGILYGGTRYFSGLLLLVCVLFSNPTFDERKREENIWVATAASFVCFFLSLLYLVFSSRVRDHQVSSIEADSEHPVTVLEPKSGVVSGTTGGDFVRVEDVQMA